jgi:hypothetical protein
MLASERDHFMITGGGARRKKTAERRQQKADSRKQKLLVHRSHPRESGDPSSAG